MTGHPNIILQAECPPAWSEEEVSKALAAQKPVKEILKIHGETTQILVKELGVGIQGLWARALYQAPEGDWIGFHVSMGRRSP